MGLRPEPRSGAPRLEPREAGAARADAAPPLVPGKASEGHGVGRAPPPGAGGTRAAWFATAGSGGK